MATAELTFNLADLQVRGLDCYVQFFNCRCNVIWTRRFAIRALITANGVRQYKLYCTGCNRLCSGAISHKKLDALTMEYADRAAFSHNSPMPACERCDDDANGVELHHWAPRAVFDDADYWPTGYLCRKCHHLWHAKMTRQTAGDYMTNRRPLPLRRHSETFEVPFGGLRSNHTVTVGYYLDGAVGEVFINGGKSGEVVEAIARDSAVLLSLALQYGADLDSIRHAITRDAQGAPSSIIGAVIDRLGGGNGARVESTISRETGKH